VKKLVIAISLVIIIILSTIGTAVMAAPPPENKPVDAWDEIVATVNELLTKIGAVTTWGTIADGIEAIYAKIIDADYGLEIIDDEVEGIAAELADGDYGLEAIDDKVTPLYDNVGSMARVKSTQGYYPLTGSSGGSFGGTGEFPGGAHHSVTIHILQIGSNDYAQVWEYYHDGTSKQIIDPVAATYTCTGKYTYETDAYEVRVYTRSNDGGDDGVPFEYYWGVTTTYCADSEEWPD
jgi:hypothetical protein